MPKNLHFYSYLSKEKIKISNKAFASGGEGALYSIASPRTYNNFIVKIYYPEKRTAEREAKMKYLLQKPPFELESKQHLPFIWVMDLIYLNKVFVGIIMKRAEGEKLTILTFAKLSSKTNEAWHRFAFGTKESFQLRLKTCFNLATVVHLIHRVESYLFVDLKPDNILIQPNGLITLVDMDSIEVIENGSAIFHASAATPEYTPPEFYTNEKRLIEESWDSFSLAVIFYQLLFGLHPFAASANPPYDNLVSLDDKIKAGLYVHRLQNDTIFKIIPAPHEKFYEAPIEIQALFQQCFDTGHQTPKLRPSAINWCITLASLLDLPFKKPHKLELKPSKLYFLPSESPRWKALELDLPLIPIDNSVSLITLDKIELPVSIPSTIWITKEVKKTFYQLTNKYNLFIKLYLTSILILATIIFFNLSTLVVLLFMFLALFIFFIIHHGKKDLLIKEIIRKFFEPKDFLVSSNLSTFYEKKINKNIISLNNVIVNINKLSFKDLPEIKIHINNKIIYVAKQKEVSSWLAKTDIELKVLRAKELDVYSKIDLEFKNNYSEQSPYDSFRSFCLFKQTLEYKYYKLKNNITYWEQVLDTPEEIDTFIISESKKHPQKEINYEQYFADYKKIKISYDEKKLKTLKTIIKNISKKLKLKHSEDLPLKDLNLLILNNITMPKATDYHAIKKVIEVKIKERIKRLNSIANQKPYKKPYFKKNINLTIDALSNLLAPFAIKNTSSYLKNSTIQDTYIKMLFTQEELLSNFQKLIEQVENLETNFSKNLALGLSDIHQNCNLLETEISTLLNIQEQYFKHSIILKIKKAIKESTPSIYHYKTELKLLDQAELIDLKNLQSIYKNTVDDNEKKIINLDLQVDNYKTDLEIDNAVKSESLKKEIEKINLIYEEVITKTTTIQEEVDAIYTSYKDTFESKMQELEGLLSTQQKSQARAKSYLSKRNLSYQNLLKKEQKYKIFLKNHNRLIKIKSFINWQEEYSQIAFIKDILTNKNQFN